MKSVLCLAFVIVAVVAGISQARPGGRSNAAAGSDRDKLIGAWHLVSLDDQQPGGKVDHVTDVKGMLVYTLDGHMSVQLMYPKSQATLSNDYVKDGYEASFGSYDVNETKHTLTHHLQGSVTEAIVGKDLPRSYRISDGRLVIQSTRPDEHWSATWAHY
jgi:hypothetical protein